MDSLVLQEKRTLDDVIRSAVKTFPNGCNYRLRKEQDGTYWLDYGCFGVLTNLVTGDARLLERWFANPDPEERLAMTVKGYSGRLLNGVVSRETIKWLLTREPCRICGGAIFAAPIDHQQGDSDE